MLRAVEDVSVTIKPGEFFGIVGRNGSGKSTLLKCLAGIYALDKGDMYVRGRLAPFIELGVGFNPELTARDNAIINAIMLGLTRTEAQERLPAIVEFAELHEFMDLRLKNYSSGMHVRLAFSVAVQVDADILLIDEVLAVGDANFQQKCFDQFARLKAEGRTIVLVTHDMSAVERFCDRAMLMERGRVVDIGFPTAIARHYNQLNFRRVREEAREQGGPDALRRAPVAELLGAWFESPPVRTSPRRSRVRSAAFVSRSSSTPLRRTRCSRWRCSTLVETLRSRRAPTSRTARPATSRPARSRPFGYVSTIGWRPAGTA